MDKVIPLSVVVVITAASTHDDMKGSYKHAVYNTVVKRS